jgi:hypothetical protein
MSSEKATSWIHGSVEEAADMLSKRAVTTRQLAGLHKEAISLSSIGQTISSNPALQKALLGAGAGAAVGGLTSLAKPKKKRKSIRSMLTGALAGGGLGVGAHYLSKALPKSPETVETFTHGGRNYELDPKALASNPAALKELNELMSKGTGEGFVGAIESSIGDYKSKHPVLATILGADIATQGLGTLSGMTGVGRYRVTQRPDIIERGISKLFKDAPTIGKDLPSTVRRTLEMADNLRELKPNELKPILQEAQKVIALGKGTKNMTLSSARSIQRIGERGLGTVRRGGLTSLFDLFRRGPVIKGEGLYEHMLKGTGTPGRSLLSFGGAKIPFTNKAIPSFDLRATPGPVSLKGILSSLRGKQYDHAARATLTKAIRGFEGLRNPFTGASRLARLGPRAAVYAGIPLLQAYAGAAGAPGEREKRIHQLIDELSK